MAHPGLLDERHHPQTVIEFTRRRGIEVAERSIFPQEPGSFSGYFLTGSAEGVTPVSEIGRYCFTLATISETLRNDPMEGIYPDAAIAAE